MTGTIDVASRDAHQALEAWYDSYKQTNGEPPKPFVINAGLISLERLKDAFGSVNESTFTTNSHRFKGTAHQVNSILEKHGENRKFKSEGGRTTGSSIPAADSLAQMIQSLTSVKNIGPDERTAIFDSLQTWLTNKATIYLDRTGIEVEINLRNSITFLVSDIVSKARKRGAGGAVAQHLVGATLAIRHQDDPCIVIDNFSTTTKDENLGRSGDFTVNTTCFHVTLSPTEALMDKCVANDKKNLRAEIVVPEDAVTYARALAQQKGLNRKATVTSIETFVGQTVDQIGRHDRNQIARALRDLFSEYNRRVTEVENDRALTLVVPDSLT